MTAYLFFVGTGLLSVVLMAIAWAWHRRELARARRFRRALLSRQR